MNSEALSTLSILAEGIPSGGGYVNPIKIAVVIVALFIWGLIIQWVDRDTDKVKTKREQWNTIVMLGGIAGFAVWLLPPWPGLLYLAGFGCGLALAGGTIIAYVVHRNGRVIPNARVLTPGHFARLLSPGEKKKKLRSDKGTRVKLVDHKGKTVPVPEEQEDADDYFAVQDFLFDMLWRRSSDCDLLAGRERYRTVFRVDGVASEKAEGLPPDEGERVFRYLKQLAGLNPEEIRRPQTGTIQVALLNHTGEPPKVEVHTSGTTAGERLRLRTQGHTELMRLPDLGFAPQRLEQLQRIIENKGGLILISSPTQHGQTTSHYALLRNHDAFLQNIYTLEKKTMLELDNITQFIFDGQNTDVNYARMLQTVLRREPEICLISDCDDRETALIASRAATDDKRIYLGIKARDCFDALTRYITLLQDNQLASEALVAIVNQRLVRKLCPECREAFRPDAETLKKLNLPAKIERFYRPPSEPLVDKKGNEIICPNCHGSGYFGRTGIFEVLEVTPDIAKLIREGAQMTKIKTEARKHRMHYLQEEGLLKVIDGTTSMNEILRVLRDNT